MYAIGAASREITACVPGVGMMGWATWDNVVEGVAQPLHVRAFVLVDPDDGRRLAFACAEICFVTQAVRDGVLARLPGWEAGELLLCATHTHSAPGGYSHHLLYNLTIPGFVPEVYEAIVDGFVEAIREAAARAVPGRVRPAAGQFSPDVPVAFNRSLAAHNLNRDLPRRFGPDEAHLAVDREMFVLRLEDEAGNPIGAIDWFSVHPINVHHDNRLISGDNAGFAASAMQRAFGNRFVAAFAQGAAGDVTPNYQYFPPRPMKRGHYEDDFESARFNGGAQAELATALFSAAGQNPALTGEIDLAFGYFDFVEADVPPRWADGYVGVRTGAGAIGARMLGGTADGPGITSVEVDVLRLLAGAARLRAHLEAFALSADAYRRVAGRFRAQGNKDVFIEPTDLKVLGVASVDRLPFPEGRDPTLGYLKHVHQRGVLARRPWTPHVLPLQLAVVGPLAIAAVPAEFTTQAGRRLRATIAEVLAERGVTRVQLTGYANAYAGYVTTPEEYDRQDYEGASTHFGRWTLGAYQTFFEQLARELLMAPAERPRRTLAPAPLDPADLEPISHAAAVAWRRTRHGA